MSSFFQGQRFRRYEVLVPMTFNDGREVPKDLLLQTVLELEHEFDAASMETAPIEGVWRREGILYRDRLLRMHVDVEDSEENREFFLHFKETLKQRFDQLDIWMTSHPIDVL